MRAVAAVAAITLAAVLTVAAIAKIRRPTETISAMTVIGLPVPHLVARILPPFELLVASILIVAPGWGGVFAFATLAAFTTLLAQIVRSGRTVSCACFGETSSRPVTAVHLARNAVLLGLAATAATFDGPIWSIV